MAYAVGRSGRLWAVALKGMLWICFGYAVGVLWAAERPTFGVGREAARVVSGRLIIRNGLEWGRPDATRAAPRPTPNMGRFAAHSTPTAYPKHIQSIPLRATVHNRPLRGPQHMPQHMPRHRSEKHCVRLAQFLVGRESFHTHPRTVSNNHFGVKGFEPHSCELSRSCCTSESMLSASKQKSSHFRMCDCGLTPQSTC